MNEIKPPWIEYPEYPPYDTFWRQAGEFYLKDMWEPYWKSLSDGQREEYLQKWHVPRKWKDFYFDTEWLDDLDDIDVSE
jgi:hypothetical protein